MTKTRILLTVALVALGAALVAAWPRPGGFSTWIAEARDGDDDWGWDLLSTEAHGSYAGDRDAYVADMRAADWGALELGPPVVRWSDDGFAHVIAELRSDPTTVPALLIHRRIVHGVCDGARPTAIGVYEDRRPFQGSAFGGGGETGGQRRCNRAFPGAGE